MVSRTTKRFRTALAELPKEIQESALASFKLFRDNPRHNSRQFKKVHPSKPIYSDRISMDYRAVGNLEEDCIVWFWVGPHNEYEEIIKHL